MMKDLINAMLYSWAATAYLMFDGRTAFRAVVDGKIKGFKPSKSVVDPTTFQMGSMFHILPDVESESCEVLEAWMCEHPELCEQFRPFYKPQNSALASGMANVASQM